MRILERRAAKDLTNACKERLHTTTEGEEEKREAGREK